VILSSNLSSEELDAGYLLFCTADELKMTGSKVTDTGGVEQEQIESGIGGREREQERWGRY
jgi:hypothetical protein